MHAMQRRLPVSPTVSSDFNCKDVVHSKQIGYRGLYKTQTCNAAKEHITYLACMYMLPCDNCREENAVWPEISPTVTW